MKKRLILVLSNYHHLENLVYYPEVNTYYR